MLYYLAIIIFKDFKNLIPIIQMVSIQLWRGIIFFYVDKKIDGLCPGFTGKRKKESLQMHSIKGKDSSR